MDIFIEICVFVKEVCELVGIKVKVMYYLVIGLLVLFEKSEIEIEIIYEVVK